MIRIVQIWFPRSEHTHGFSLLPFDVTSAETSFCRQFDPRFSLSEHVVVLLKLLQFCTLSGVRLTSSLGAKNSRGNAYCHKRGRIIADDYE